MHRSSLYVLLTTLLGVLTSLAAHAAEPSSTYLRDWLVCGPVQLEAPTLGTQEFTHLRGFGRSYLQTEGTEGDVRPKAGDVVDYLGGTMVWKAYNSPTDIVSLDTAIGTQNHVLAYAYTTVESDKDQAAVLSLGSNDGCRVWLNGERVFDYPQARGVLLDDDYVPVFLRKGTNHLLFKVEEHGNEWGFGCRFIPMDKDDAWKKLRFFEVASDKNNVTHLEFLGPDSLLDVLFDNVDIAVHHTKKRNTPYSALNWDQTRKMQILDARPDYGEYQIDLIATFRGGDTVTYNLPFSVGTPIDYVLFEDGKSDYTIHIADDASETIQWAAKELQQALLEISGAELSIVNSLVNKGEKFIEVSLYQEGLQENPNIDRVIYNDFRGGIEIQGYTDRGVLYAVMAFLENELGVRYYTPSVTVMPKRDRYTYRHLDFWEDPGLRVRNTFYKEAFDPTWAARNRSNGAMGTRKQPGGVEGYWGVHTFFPLMPPEEFFETHPEYYSLIDGKRIYERAQLCLTHPDVLDIITERLREKMRAHPENLIYSISQNDWRQPCQCNDCAAIAKKEESEAGPMLWFVNQVAERVEDEFPDKLIGTLAYQYTRKPPKHIRPRENVVIRFCSIECCFVHDFKSCPQNEDFLDDLVQWSKVADKIYVWDYVVNFANYIMPFPNFDVLQSNIQTFRDYNAIGIMEQGAYQSRGGEFSELKAYLIAKLLWNPEADTEAIIDDFMYGYYGRAGQHIRAYFDLCQDLVQPDTHLRIFSHADHPIYSDEFIRDGERIFRKAKSVADSPAYLQRVEMAELPLLYLKCRRLPQEALQDGSYAQFMAIVEREGITHFAEHDNGFADFMERQKEL